MRKLITLFVISALLITCQCTENPIFSSDTYIKQATTKQTIAAASTSPQNTYMEFIKLLARDRIPVKIYNPSYDKYLFVSNTKKGKDNVVEAHGIQYKNEDRNNFLLIDCGNNKYKLYNPSYSKMLFVSNDKSGQDNIVEAHNNQSEERNTFQIEFVNVNHVRIFNPTYNQYIFVSNDMDQRDNIVEAHKFRYEDRNLFTLVANVKNYTPTIVTYNNQITFRSANIGGSKGTTDQSYYDLLDAFRSSKAFAINEIWGFQEDRFPQCGATSCLNNISKNVLGNNISIYHPDGALTTLVKGGSIAFGKCFEIGNERRDKGNLIEYTLNILGKRHMIQSNIEIGGRIIPFYTVHLSHGDQRVERNTQLRRLIEIIINNSQNTQSCFQTLPILVGDVNFYSDQDRTEPENLALLKEFFDLIQPNAFDQIWVGKKNIFNGTSFTVVSQGVAYSHSNTFDHNFPFAELRMNSN